MQVVPKGLLKKLLPESITTLPELVALRAKNTGARIAFTYEGQGYSFDDLWLGARRFARLLLERGLARGERVLIALPNGPAFFSAFYGAQVAGGTAVPIFPGSGRERMLRFAGLCGARILVLTREGRQAWGEAKEPALDLPLEVVDVRQSLALEPLTAYPLPGPDDLAFIQYTSGSTGEPKGVMLSHRNLLTNAGQMIAGMEISSTDVFVSWLPAYHDMGLILMTICPLYVGSTVHLLPADIRRLGSWLEIMASERATFTAAPDFAYRLCVRQFREKNPPPLSSLRVALNAAEPVRLQTATDFESTFGLQKVMTAGYGLAEATVGVSMSRPGAGLRVDAHGIVSVGRPFPQVEVRIVQGRQTLPSGQVGEIIIRSPANTRGYLGDPSATAGLQWGEGFILSGDLGYLDETGELYILGRSKAVIKRSGETIAPQEIEAAVDRLTFVRFSAALGIDRGGAEGEQVYVFTELRQRTGDGQSLHELALEIVQAIQARMGFRPGRVYLVGPHSIPRTDNGKLQYGLLRERYLDGTLRSSGAILYPEY